jgi:hypothetical protein
VICSPEGRRERDGRRILPLTVSGDLTMVETLSIGRALARLGVLVTFDDLCPDGYAPLAGACVAGGSEVMLVCAVDRLPALASGDRREFLVDAAMRLSAAGPTLATVPDLL